MKILAIETSTPTGSVAMTDGDNILWECTINTAQTHSETLLGNIEHGLRTSNIKKDEIVCIAISRGPGSFTGLRIGMTTAKTLAYSLRIPIVAVSSLLAYAYNFSFMKEPLCPMLDARKKEVYSGIYRFQADGVRTLLPDGAYGPEEVLRLCPEGTIVFGTGAELYRNIILSYNRKFNVLPLNLASPRASTIALLGYKKFTANEFEDVKTLAPNYCRKSEAEITSRTKEN